MVTRERAFHSPRKNSPLTLIDGVRSALFTRGKAMQPKLILHGGAGRAMRDIERKREVREALRHIAQVTYNRLLQGTPAIEAVIHGCLLLEDDPHFNAGTGSAIQQDGQVRLSASVMDGTRQSFSGVINAMRVRNPIRMAAHLQNFPDRILSDTGCHDLARELQLPLYDALTEKRLSEWFKERARNFQSDIADVVSEDQNPEEARDEAKKPTTTSESEEAALTDKGHGTIGVVALDSNGHLAVGTSTGGRGFERPGRVSDSATPSGNYATADAAVSCTGIGEHIFDESLAPRIVVRVTDGAQLSEAMQRSMNEAHARNRFFAAIGITKDGEIGWGKTTDILLAAFCDGNSTGDTLDLPPGLVASVRGT